MRDAGTSFNGVLSSSTFDHARRLHEQRRKDEARAARAESWLASKLAGQTFHSFESLRYAAIRTYETLRQRPCDADEHALLTAAARTVWCGLSQTRRAQINVVGSVVQSVTFRAA